MAKKTKEPEYELCPPTPEAVALIARGVQEHRDGVMEDLLAALWERHTDEIEDGHGGDKTCSYCDTMREAARLLGFLSGPREAGFQGMPRGPIYKKRDL